MNSDSCPPGSSAIAREILTYLFEHPDAQDTLEGVLEWWLLERKIRYQSALVKEALAKLVKDGFVIERRRQDSLTCYHINRGKKGEIEEFLRECSGK